MEDGIRGHDGGDGSHHKRKKHRSFLQKNKRFGKSGRFGQGSKIDKDTFDYFVRVLEQINKGFEKDEEDEKEIFVTNVFRSTEGKETMLCSNQLVSRILEQLLDYANEDVIKRYMDVLAQDLRIVCTDPFASHIVEKLLSLTTFSDAENRSADLGSFSSTWLLRVSKFCVNNFDEFCVDAYASHVLRTVIQCLAGFRIADETMTRSKRSRDVHASTLTAKTAHKKEIPVEEIGSDRTDVLKDAARRFKEAENKKSLVENQTAAGVVQVLIAILSRVAPDECKKLCVDILETAFPEEDGSDIPGVFESQATCRVLEAILGASSSAPKLAKKVFKRFFGGRMCALAKHQVANFAVQKLLSSCIDKETFEHWYEEEIDSNMEDLIRSGHPGVLLALAQACGRLYAKQNHFIVALMKALECHDPAEAQLRLVPLLTRLGANTADLESNEAKKSSSVSNHGSRIVQELLSFNKPIKIVNSLLALKPWELSELLSEPKGCHIAKAFTSSNTVGEKSRDALAKALGSDLVALACSKHGSLALDAILSTASPKARDTIATELAAKESLLKASEFGRFFCHKLALSTFKHDRAEWKRGLDKQQKKRELFGDLIASKQEPVASLSKKSKKRERKGEDENHGDGFYIDTHGEEDIEASCKESIVKETPPPQKKAKKKVKSYLDDL